MHVRLLVLTHQWIFSVSASYDLHSMVGCLGAGKAPFGWCGHPFAF